MHQEQLPAPSTPIVTPGDREIGGNAICTILASNYISFGRVLTKSFKKYNPGIPVFILLIDEPHAELASITDDFKLIKLEDLQYPQITSLLFKYNILEVCTAIKPYLLQYLFQKYKIRKLAYFDPDILFTNSIDEIWKLLDEYSIVLTPHLTEPIPVDDVCRPTEIELLKCGTYNLGFIGVANNERVRGFLEWWKERLDYYCFRDHAFLFVDQKWIDLIIGYYDDVYILRDPAFNVAYWNLQSRDLQLGEDGISVNGRPMKFFHFSGLVMEDPISVSKYQNRYTLKDLRHLIPLFEGYKRQVIICGYQKTKKIPYAFDHFDNGIKICEYVRKLYLRESKRDNRFGNPFKVDCEHSYFKWLNDFISNEGDVIPVSNLWYSIYRERPDVQAAYPDIFKSEACRRAFLEWCINFGKNEYEIDDVFLEPVYRVLKIPPPDRVKAVFGGRRAPLSLLYNFMATMVVRIFGRNSMIIRRLTLIKQGLMLMFKS